MAVDAQRFVELMTYIPLVVAIPVEVCLTIYFLWSILGNIHTDRFTVNTLVSSFTCYANYLIRSECISWAGSADFADACTRNDLRQS